MYGKQSIKLIVFFTSMLFLPMVILWARNGRVIDIYLMVVSTLGFAIFLYSVSTILGRRSLALAAFVSSLLLLCALIIRFVFGFLYDFSGHGFGSEFFIHFNRTSLMVGLDEYSSEIKVVLIVFVLATVASVHLARVQRPGPIKPSMYGLAISIVLIYIGSVASPEIRLAQAYWKYQDAGDGRKAETERTLEEISKALEFLRGSNSLPVNKRQLESRLPEHPSNLVLVYLESFNLMLTEFADYPGLTPRINEFKERFHSFSNIRSSGYFTMEGIANSQCGTVLNMEHANNSLLTREGRLPSLPCLGDVLRSAGYRQVYLGGAKLVFAGKGMFFRDHGYDEVIGWEYWRERGHERISNWGLSDAELFDQAFEYVRDMHGGPMPFNLTLLTLGTHLPGFKYEGCPKYTDDDNKRFLNAIHCTDFLLGRFMDRLVAAGILEDTVLFIQADHGVFENPDMKRLFGKQVSDKRLLTLLSIPKRLQDVYPLKQRKDAVGASVDTVATLVDLLEIETNAEFIFAKSHFDEKTHPVYYLTRREDYLDGKAVFNTPANCDDNTGANLVLPLDRCGKQRVLETISSLSLVYSDHMAPNTEVCELSAEVHIDAAAGDFRIKWGNQILSDRFYHRGVQVPAGKSKGVYTVLLNKNDDVTRTLFFRIDNKYDLTQLSNLLRYANSEERILLIRNAELVDLKVKLRKLLPEEVRDNTLIYGFFDGQRLVPEMQTESTILAHSFVPGSCVSGLKVLDTGQGASPGQG